MLAHLRMLGNLVSRIEVLILPTQLGILLIKGRLFIDTIHLELKTVGEKLELVKLTVIA